MSKSVAPIRASAEPAPNPSANAWFTARKRLWSSLSQTMNGKVVEQGALVALALAQGVAQLALHADVLVHAEHANHLARRVAQRHLGGLQPDQPAVRLVCGSS
jgi:hypothetical protein